MGLLPLRGSLRRYFFSRSFEDFQFPKNILQTFNLFKSGFSGHVWGSHNITILDIYILTKLYLTSISSHRKVISASSRSIP